MENRDPEILNAKEVNKKWLRRIMQKRLSTVTWNYFFDSWTFAFIPFLGFGLSTLGVRYFSQYPLMHIFLVSIAISTTVWWIFYLALQNWIYAHSKSVRTAKILYLRYYVSDAKEKKTRYKAEGNFIMAGRVGRCIDNADSMMKKLEEESRSTIGEMDNEPLDPIDEHDPRFNPNESRSSRELIDGSSNNDQGAVPSTQ